MADKIFTTIGLMSGTSLDGIDAAVIRTDGVDRVETGEFLTIPYKTDFRERLRACLGKTRATGSDVIPAVEEELTQLHAEAVNELLKKANLKPSNIDFIGFHGHTIFHAPHKKQTLQIGDGAALAKKTGIAVINDFRSDDVQSGGQGAPLVPLYHNALAANLQKPLAILIIGGVANITWIGKKNKISAFDTGPGVALIDDWMLTNTGKSYDEDGQFAKSGHPDGPMIRGLLENPYFNKLPPKSLDRDAWTIKSMIELSPADGAATLTAFTVMAIAKGLTQVPDLPNAIYVCGGGRKNSAIMALLETVTGINVRTVDTLGWNGDALEAQAFGYLAVRSYLGLPITIPSTTNVSKPITGGHLHPKE